MKRINPPVHAPKKGLPTTSMADILGAFVIYRAGWQSSRERNAHLGEILDELERAPMGPWDLTDKAVESLLSEMQGVNVGLDDKAMRLNPLFLKFFTRCLDAVWGAEEAPDEKPRAELNGKTDTGTAGATAQA